ncbi:MAG: hypothetical protein EOO66_07150, partial [Methylobacterium sp.]
MQDLAVPKPRWEISGLGFLSDVAVATGQPFDPWDPQVGPRSENYGRLLKQEKLGAEEAIFVITKKKDLLVNPDPKRGAFHHSSFEAGAPVLAPGRLNLSHD